MYWQKEQCLATLEQAILAVRPSYFKVELPDGEIQHGERILTYELYHQMRLAFPVKHGTIHGEHLKGLRHVPALGRNDIYIPDLVLHQSGTMDGNLLAIEVKASRALSIKSVMADLNKLEYYTDPRGLNFKIGVMFVANSDFQVLLDKPGNAEAISFILNKGPRVAIWNIASPTGKVEQDGETRSLNELDPDCLKIFRADDVAALARR